MSGTLINLVHIAKTQNRNLVRGSGVVEKMAKDKAADGGIAQIVRSASVNGKKTNLEP